MGFYNRMRKREAGGARFGGGAGAPTAGMNLDLASGGVKPPFCPFLAGKHVAELPGGTIALPGGAKQINVQVQLMPMPCWRDACMLWDAEAKPPCCGLLSLMDAVLYDDEDDGDGGEGVPSGKGE